MTNRLGMPVATGRLLPAQDGVSRIGRMAVSQPLRGTGLGREVLEALMTAARERGDQRVMSRPSNCSNTGSASTDL